MQFSELEAVYRKWLYLDHDPDLLRAIFAIYIANRYDGPPVWVMVIGKAGCGKSELLATFDECEKTVMVSKLTPNALASGYAGGDHSLLHELKDNKIMIVKDMSTLTELPAESRAQIFSDLRDAFDGKFVKVHGAGRIEFEGKFGILAGATDAVEKSRQQETSLGERFMYLRIRLSPNQEMEIQLRSGANVGRYKQMKKEMSDAAAKFMKELKVGKKTRITEKLRDDIYKAARVLARGRSAVSRDRYTKDVDSPAGSGEIPTRVTGQLLLIALACQEMGSDEVEVRRIVYRMCLDSMPGIRMRIIRGLCRGNQTTDELKKIVRMSPPTIKRYLEDMEYLGLAEHDAHKWVIVDEDLVEMVNETF